MPLFPVKDRTIRLTLEKVTKDGSSQATTASQPRFISQFIPNSGVLGGIVANLGKSPVEATLDLVGPVSIDINHSAAVAAEPGLFTSFLQPWFIKPVTVTITGTSYIGAYSGMARADRDAKGLLEKFRSSQNDFIDLGGGKPGSGRRILLELTGLPRGLSRFIGYMTDLNFKEGIQTAYLLNYTMSFVGRPADDTQVRRGKQNGITANQMGGIVNR